MARVLIVGCGCRGQELARGLRAAGHAVRGTTRDASGLETIEAAGAEDVPEAAVASGATDASGTADDAGTAEVSATTDDVEAPASAEGAAVGAADTPAPVDEVASVTTDGAEATASAGSEGADASPEGDGGKDAEPAEEIVLERGQTSEQVRELQARLAQLGHFTAQPTGFYGDVTFGAVSEYQRAAGLDISGTVFASTWDALTSELPSWQNATA